MSTKTTGRLRVKHQTGFRYGGPATASYNEARMLPVNDERQIVVSSELRIEPPTPVQYFDDYWGTRVSAFDVLEPHESMTITAESVVDLRVLPSVSHRGSWSDLSEMTGHSLRMLEQQTQLRTTKPPRSLLQAVDEADLDDSTPCALAREVCEFVGDQVEYMPGSTVVTTTAADAWEKRQGVCQDITHIALGVLRERGIPARYVSGYLHPNPDPAVNETETGESHAWLEWFCCGGWHGYDPTNLVDIGLRHVIVGRGRDYHDVSPLRGVYAGPASTELFVSVEVTALS